VIAVAAASPCDTLPAMRIDTRKLLVLALAGGCSDPASDAPDESESTAAASTSSASTSLATSESESTAADTTTGGEPQHPAANAFWTAFLAEDYAGLAQVIADLDAAVEESPDDPQLVLLRAHAHLWRLAEWARDPDQDPTLQIVSAMAATQSFAHARELSPDDFRIPCWLGVMKVNTGKVLGDDALIAEGKADVDTAVDGFPEFALFCRMLLNEGEPYDSPEFQQAVDDMWTTLDLCEGAPVDREAPMLSLDGMTMQGDTRVCWNLVPKAVHNWQGFFLHAGDIIAKSGDVDVATILYQDAMAIDWDSYAHADLIDARLADLPARAASYADADPSNDAEIGSDTFNCTMCHGQTN
jgi:hypothetical protein